MTSQVKGSVLMLTVTTMLGVLPNLPGQLQLAVVNLLNCMQADTASREESGKGSLGRPRFSGIGHVYAGLSD